MANRAHDPVGHPAGETGLGGHQAEHDGGEEEPRCGFREAAERGREAHDAEHPEQIAPDDPGDAVIHGMRDPGADHERRDGERFLRVGFDVERCEPQDHRHAERQDDGDGRAEGASRVNVVCRHSRGRRQSAGDLLSHAICFEAGGGEPCATVNSQFPLPNSQGIPGRGEMELGC